MPTTFGRTAATFVLLLAASSGADAPACGATLTGRVLDRGHGVAGARVVASPPGGFGSTDTAPAYSAVTDTHGGWVLKLPVGYYGVRVESPGRLPSPRVEVHLDDTRDLTLELIRGRTLEGTVRDAASGKPVAGVSLSASCGGAGRADDVPLDTQGRFALETPPDVACALIARTAGGLLATAGIEPAQPAERIILDLRPGGSLTGRVTGRDGRSQAGATVTVSAARTAAWGPVRVEADRRGRYVVRGLPPGELRVTAEARAHAPREQAGWLGAQAAETLDIALPPAAEVKGRVVDAGGRGVAGAQIVAHQPPLDGSGARVVHGRADVNGRFELDGLAAGPVTLGADDSRGRSAVATAEVRENGGPSVTLTLTPAASATGMVRYSDGHPAAGVRVESSRIDAGDGPWASAQAVTDADGRYLLAPLPPGAHRVTATRRGPTVFFATTPAASRQQEVSLAASERRDGVDFVLPRAGRRLRGTVVDADGAPVAGARVGAFDARLTPSPATELEWALTGADGTFSLDDLDEVDLVVRVAREGYPDGEWRIAPGEPRAGTLALTRPASIAGTVVHADGTPAGDVVVAARPVDASVAAPRPSADSVVRGMPSTRRSARVQDEEGRFTLAGLAAGRYELRATTRDGRSGSAWIEVRAGAVADTRVLIGTGVAIEGRVVDPEGRPVAGAWVRVAGGTPGALTAGTDADGRFTLAGVPPDPHVRLAVATAERAGTASIPIPPEATHVDAGAIVLSRLLPHADASARALPLAP